jgi:TonB family protein
MAMRSHRLLAAIAFGTLPLASLPIAASAQTTQFYAPPKIVKFGSHATPNSGSGTVTVKVFVKRNGSVGSAQVVKSTNRGDDQAALEIAKSSIYKPGTRDGKPEDAFYTIALKFSGSSFAADTGTASSGTTAAATALLNAGKYAQAKTELQAYVAAHPEDKNAQALLGDADAHVGDTAGAVGAFDAAGTIPSVLAGVAAKAYADAAAEAIKANDNAKAAALAQKSLAAMPTTNGYYLGGVADLNAKQYAKAVTELEHAKAFAQKGNAPASSLNEIDGELVTAYVLAGEQQKAVTLAQELKRRDPSNPHVDDAIAAAYGQEAQAAAKAGDTAKAVAQFEAAAKAAPSHAAVFYVDAASVLAGASSPDWKKVKAEADKALAADPNNASAAYLAGVASANSGDRNGAITYLQKAKANAGSDAKLAANADAALKQLGQK